MFSIIVVRYHLSTGHVCYVCGCGLFVFPSGLDLMRLVLIHRDGCAYFVGDASKRQEFLSSMAMFARWLCSWGNRCVCMCMCVYLGVRVCMHAYEYPCILSVSMHVLVSVYMLLNTCVYVCVYLREYVYNFYCYSYC